MKFFGVALGHWLVSSSWRKFRDERRLYIEWLLLVVLALGSLTVLTVMQWGVAPGHVVYDQFQRSRATLPSNDIVIIGIDDTSLGELGGWPLKRQVYADLLQKLADTHNHPKAIGFDIFFSDASAHDAALAQQMRRHNAFLAIEQPRFKTVGPLEKRLPRGVLREAAKGLAHVNVAFEADGFSRGAFLQVDDLPHLALAVSGQTAQNFATHGGYRRFNVIDPEIGFPIVSLAYALSDRFPLEVLKGKYLLIGAIAPSLGDHFPTVYSGRQGSGTPGVVLHASLLNDILRGNLIRPVAMWVQWGVSLTALLSVLMALVFFSPIAEFVLAATTALGVLALSWGLLTWGGVWFDPSLCILAIALVKLVWAWRRTEMIVRFLGDRAAKLEIAHDAQNTDSNGRSPKLGGHNRKTVLQSARLLDDAIGASNEYLALLNRIVAEIPTAMLVADADQRLVLTNPRMAQDVPSALLHKGQSLLPFMTFWGFDAHQNLNQLKGTDHHVSGLDPQGKKRHYIFRIVQLASEQGDVLWVFALTDITEIQQFQAQREQTLQLLSHDMRTPIASILALSRQQQTSSSVIGGARCASDADTPLRIASHADKLLSMMDDFIYAIKAQEPHYKLTETLLESLVDDAIYQVKDLATNRQMRLVQTFDDEPQFVMVDARLFTRMLVNLLVNAVRHGKADSEILIVMGHHSAASASAHVSEAALSSVHITITNRVDDQPHALRFASSGPKGFGLGLAFVKTVIAKHRGEFEFDLLNTPQALARVHCTFPGCVG
jgi:CHASE2 domain-containing sensor protein/signal transduction histidine kinase